MQKHSYRGNWKMYPENNVDGYHILSTHKTYMQYLTAATGGMAALAATFDDATNGVLQDLGEGSGWGFLHGPNGEKLAPEIIAPVSKEAADQYIDAMTEYLGNRDSAVAAFNSGLSSLNTYIFPNLLLVSTMVTVVQPVAPNRTIVSLFAPQFVGAPDELNRARMRACNFDSGTSVVHWS